MIFANARVVTPHDVVHGVVEIRGGTIADVGCGTNVPPGALDLEGDFLIPGLVDLHTDAFLNHYAPRPGVRWPVPAALASHDAQMAASGVTTVFDALPLGAGGEEEDASRERLQAAIDELHQPHTAHLRAEHFLHLRLEVSHPDTAELFPRFVEVPLLRLVSMMDHTPGQGQFADIDRWKKSFGSGMRVAKDPELRLREKIEFHHRYAGPNRKAIASMARERGLPLASHDDRTVAEVEDSATAGVSISEFPVTLEAAEAAHSRGLDVLMGGPDLVLGRSHSGNASAAEVADHGWLNGLTSDYVPSSLLHGAFLLAESCGRSLPEAIAMVTSAPARIVHLNDRGAIARGLRADLARVRPAGGIPRVVSVWREGQRVA